VRQQSLGPGGVLGSNQDFDTTEPAKVHRQGAGGRFAREQTGDAGGPQQARRDFRLETIVESGYRREFHDRVLPIRP
jgi:hypothetical protein